MKGMDPFSINRSFAMKHTCDFCWNEATHVTESGTHLCDDCYIDYVDNMESMCDDCELAYEDLCDLAGYDY